MRSFLAERSFAKQTLLAQVVPLANSIASASSNVVYTHGFNFPVVLPALTYSVLCFIFSVTFFIRKSCHGHTSGKLRFSVISAGAGIFSCVGFVLVLKGIQRTSLVFSSLSNTFAGIAVTISTSVLLLKYRYHFVHLVSVLIAVIGFALILCWKGRGEESSNNRFGIFLCILAGASFGIEATILEWLMRVTGTDMSDMMMCLTGSSSVCCWVYIFATASDELIAFRNSWEDPWAVAGISAFVACSVVSSLTTPHVISACGSSFFNLSLLTGNFYNVINDTVFFDVKFSEMYIIGAAIMLTGLIMFTWFAESAQPESLRAQASLRGLDGT